MRMKTEDLIHMRGEETIDHLLEKIEDVHHRAKEAGWMSHDNVECLEKCWKTICLILQIDSQKHQ